jgi:hypothetical protein
MLHRLLVNAAGNGTVRIEATTASSVLGTTGNSALNGAQSIAANATLEYPFVSQKEGALKGVTGQALIIGSTATTLAGFAIVSNEST